MAHGNVFQLKQRYESSIRYSRGGYISLFHEGRWWSVRFGPAFLNLGFNTTLSTLENEDGESLDVVFRCYKQHELQSICIGELSELLVPLRDFNAGVAYALGVEALPD